MQLQCRQMKQRTLAMMNGFERYSKKTRRAMVLDEMEQVVPWSKLCGLIEPYYPTAGNGRPPVGVERMLRIYFLQQWFNLSDPGVEEALYDSAVMRSFVGIDLGNALFLDEMEQAVPWGTLWVLIAPYYPSAGNGRPPVGVERMLRIYFLQQWFNLSDPGVEEALYDRLN